MPDRDAFTLPAMTPADALAEQAHGAFLIDMRKLPARAASGRTVAGAVLRDPFTFGHDDPLMQDERPLITFCVHGHEVSQFACALLMIHGRRAAYVTGGFEALLAAGARLEDLSPEGSR